MKKIGLIGKSLKHSFSQRYFTEKFHKMGIQEFSYQQIETEHLKEIVSLLKNEPSWIGFNVTIPYKEDILSHIDSLDEKTEKIGAVNVIKVHKNNWRGYNTDYSAFKKTLINWLPSKKPNTLILGTGGASRAIAEALKTLKIPFVKVSRTPQKGEFSYEQLKNRDFQLSKYPLIINCTPLGTIPDPRCPELPYENITENHFLYDLVYNPEITPFLKRGIEKKACVKNGLEMLYAQAEDAWKIWNDYGL